MFEDIKYCKTAIFICVLLAFVYNTLYIYAMSHYADALAKFGVLIIEALLVSGIGASYMQTRDPDNDA